MGLETLEDFERRYCPDARLVMGEDGEGTQILQSMKYVLLLLERGTEDDRGRACDILRHVSGLQLVEPEWRYGQLPIRTERNYTDRNSNCFLMPFLLEVLTEHREQLPIDLRAEFATVVERATVFLERRWDNELFVPHRDGVLYTNIFLLYIQGLLLAAQYYDSERLLLKGKAQWRRWFNHVAYNGMDEFASPTYSRVDYEALTCIHELAPTARMREEARLVLDHLCTLQYAVSHPVLKMPVCGASRCYRRYLAPGNEGVPLVEADDAGPYRQPEAARREYAQRTFPHEASGRATAVPHRFQSWQVADAGMGSMTGGNYFPQNIHCIVAVGRSSEEKEVLTVPGSHTFRSGFCAQAGPNALCVFTRRPQYYNRTQYIRPDEWMDEVEEKHPPSIGVSEGWDLREEPGRLVANAYGRAVHVFPFMVDGVDAVPAPLERKQLLVYHHSRTCYLFPQGPEWFGCAVVLATQDQEVPTPDLSFRIEEREARVTCGDALCLRLFLQPAGEVTQLYGDDWRATPLFNCPVGTLWPGEMAAAIANGEFALEEPPWC